MHVRKLLVEPRGKKDTLDINTQLRLLYLGITQKLYSCSRSTITPTWSPFGPKTGKDKISNRVVLEQYVASYSLKKVYSGLFLG